MGCSAVAPLTCAELCWKGPLEGISVFHSPRACLPDSACSVEGIGYTIKPESSKPQSHDTFGVPEVDAEKNLKQVP